MSDLRIAAQQALEALEYGQHSLKQISEYQWESRGQLAMDALKAAQEQPEPAQEPVAWMNPDDGRVIPAQTMRHAREGGGASLSSVRSYTVPLGPIRAQRPPLTDEEIAAEWRKASECAGKSKGAVTTSQFVQIFARAIERKVRGEKE